MSKDNITPAVNLQEELPSELSATEFQQKLYGWFEDRGLLSELRAHLRKQMIGALKDTAIGRTAVGQQKQAISPKLQALNLLIAEFLLHQDYHYSLSVFSTEVPLISVLPEFPSLAVNNLEHRTVSKKWQFSEKDMWDILETLGVTQGTDEGQNIYGSYYNTINKEPLLICIVRMLHSIQNKFRTNLCHLKEVEHKAVPCSSTQIVTSDSQQQWVRTISQILNSNNVHKQNTNEILNIMIDEVESEKERLERESKEKYLKLQMKLQTHIERREKEQKKKWSQLSKSLEFEKTKVESEKRRQQMEVDNLKTKLQRHQHVLRERCQQVLARERSVQEREYQLQQRENDVEKLQQHLQADFESLRQEQTTVSELQETLKLELVQKHTAAKNDVEFLKNLQDECNNMKTQITNTQEAVLNASNLKNGEHGNSLEHDAEQELVKNIMKQLHLENISLRNVNTEQQQRIDELSQRATALMHDLENTQATVDVLSSNRHLFSAGIVSAPPLVAPPGAVLAHQRNGMNNYSSGGGEDSSRALPAPPRQYRHFPSPSPRDVKRRTPPRRLTVHSSSASDDTTPSKDILHEARDKLRRLEAESDEVDRNYQQFKLRRTEEGRFSASRHFRHSPFEETPWISAFNREYEPLQHQEVSPTSPQHGYGLLDLYDQAINIPGPSTSNISRPTSPQYNNREDFNFNLNMAFDAGKTDATNHFRLSKYLKQANNLTLSQNAVQDANQISQNHFIQLDMNQHSSSNRSLLLSYNQKSVNAETNLQNREKDGNGSANQSVASSGVLEDLLAVGVSGVSGLSDDETTDKSELDPDSVTE